MTSDDDMVSADDITTMADEVRRGLRPSESRVRMTAAHQQVWDDLADQVGRPANDE
jgi:hypothetical protein